MVISPEERSCEDEGKEFIPSDYSPYYCATCNESIAHHREAEAQVHPRLHSLRQSVADLIQSEHD